MNTAEHYLEQGVRLRTTNKPQEAIAELTKALDLEPTHEFVLAELVLCYLALSDYTSANFFTDEICHYHPKSALGVYLKATMALQKDQLAVAEDYIRQAIQLNPFVAEFWAVLSAIFIQRKSWNEALKYVHKGLELEPDNNACLNYQTICLNQLGHTELLQDSMEETLYNNPNDAFSHANIGWALLQNQEVEQAKTHFAEALRLDPNMKFARHGMIESIKSQNWIYRQFLAFSFFLSKHNGLVQLAIIIGLMMGANYLGDLSDQYPWILPIYLLVVVVFYVSWIIEPLGNLFLRLNKFGNLALSPTEKRASEIVGIGLVGGIASTVYYFATGATVGWIGLLFCFTIIIPLSQCYSMGFLKNRKWLPLSITGLLILMGAFNIILVTSLHKVSNFITYYEYLFVAYLWLINLGVIKDEEI